MHEDLPYVTRRTNASGSVRWYWQRRGHKLVRLPDDPVERLQLVRRLNDAAARDAAITSDSRGSIGWVVAKYRASEDYEALAPGTRKYYDPIIEDVLALGRGRPFNELNRMAVVDYVESWPDWHQQRKDAAVLRNLFHTAAYNAFGDRSHGDDLRISSGKARSTLWQSEHVAAWLAAAADHRHARTMISAMQLLRYTAQRPSDCLAMTGDNYTGDRVQLRQAKTATLVWVPAHRDLRSFLDNERRADGDAHLIGGRTTRVPYTSFILWFSEIRKAAGLDALDLQPRDLRRTAAVHLAEAGCTAPEIAAITGHSIEEAQRILDTYVPRTYDMAKNAMQKWEKQGRRRKEGG